MWIKLGVGIISRLFQKRDKMTLEEFKIEQLKVNRFPMLVYPKGQKWDGKDIRKMRTISVKSAEELEEIKDTVFLDWKDLLKTPTKKAAAKPIFKKTIKKK
jgi:hypothetical protein